MKNLSEPTFKEDNAWFTEVSFIWAILWKVSPFV